VKRFLPWLLVILLPFVMIPQSKTQRQRELTKIRSRLTQVKKEISAFKKQEKGVAREIDLLQEQVSLTQRLISELRRSQRSTQTGIDSLQSSIDSLVTRLQDSKDNLRRRLVSLYKRGQFYDMELVFGASSVAEVYDRIYFTRYAARAEERLFETLLDAKTQVEQKQDSLELFNAELLALLAEQQAAKDSLASAKRSKQRKLSQIKTSKKSKEKLQKELNARRRELEKLLASMAKKSASSPDRKPTGTIIEKGKGTLPWPVTSRKVIASFGTIIHPRYNTKTYNDGIDIDCSGTRTVKAINKGKVEYAEHLTGYGLLVLIDHQDGYYSLYGNLDKISVKKGQNVSQGQTLGTASDYLHFSISKGSEFRNPINYLK
jgi:septal ring factor EnvC (AmiA/AmiB activator)